MSSGIWRHLVTVGERGGWNIAMRGIKLVNSDSPKVRMLSMPKGRKVMVELVIAK